jgi:alkylhydroperoxidase/carboxymuconolactone decarboxylase family protein YurZ
VPARYKALAATLWAVSARCEPCFKFYVQVAVRLGATQAESGIAAPSHAIALISGEGARTPGARSMRNSAYPSRKAPCGK